MRKSVKHIVRGVSASAMAMMMSVSSIPALAAVDASLTKSWAFQDSSSASVTNDVIWDIENVTMQATNIDTNYTEGTDDSRYYATFAADAGYVLPSSIVVSHDNNEIQDQQVGGEDVIVYDASTGSLIIRPFEAIFNDGQGVNVTLTALKEKGFEVDKTTVAFPAEDPEYATIAGQKVTVSRDAAQTVENLRVALTGAGKSNFEISSTLNGTYKSTSATADLTGTNTEASLYVRPKDGLAAGTYTANLVFSADGCDNQTVKLTFEVNAANVDVKANVTSTQGKVTILQNGVAVSNPATVKEGDEVTFIAEAKTGYKFKNWTAGTKVVSYDEEYTIAKIKAETDLTANFMATASTVYVNGVALNKTTTTEAIGSGSAEFDADAGTITLKDVEITESNAGTKKAGVFANGAIKVILEGNSTIDISDVDGIRADGPVEISGTGTLTIVNVNTAINADGELLIKGVKVDVDSQNYGISSADSVTIEDSTVVGTSVGSFINSNTGTVIVSGDSVVSGSSSAAKGIVADTKLDVSKLAKDASVEATAASNGISVDLADAKKFLSNDNIVVMRGTKAEDAEVVNTLDSKTAKYTKITATENMIYITVEASPANGGTVSGEGAFIAGNKVKAKAAAKEGYTFSKWVAKNNTKALSTEAEYTFDASENLDLVAIFTKGEEPAEDPQPEDPKTVEEINEFTVRKAVGEFKVRPQTGSSTTVSDGGSFEFKIAINDGYKAGEKFEVGYRKSSEDADAFTKLTAKEDVYKVENISEDVVIVARGIVEKSADEPIVEETFNVTVKANDTKFGSVRGAGEFATGEKVTVKATARDGYKFEAWLEGDKEVSKDAEYTFEVSKDTDLIANFAEDKAASTNKGTKSPTVVDDKLSIHTTGNYIKSVNDLKDVKPNTYYYDAVKWAVKKGIIAGDGEDNLGVGKPCNRGQVITLLWKAINAVSDPDEKLFDDIKTKDYYSEAVRWAKKAGVTAGTSSTTFSPDMLCSRAMMVQFLWREAGSPKMTGECKFKDVPKDAYYYQAVIWATENGITKGISATEFGPNQACLKEQAMVFLYKAYVE